MKYSSEELKMIYLKQAIKRIHSRCLVEESYASQVMHIIASIPYESEEFHHSFMRTEFEEKMIEDFEYRMNLIKRGWPVLRNAIRLLGDYNHKVHFINSNIQTAFIAPALTIYLAMLLISKQEPDLELFTIQILMNGRYLKLILPRNVRIIFLQIREMLANDTTLSYKSKLWLKLALDIKKFNYRCVPKEMLSFYTAKLGNRLITNLEQLNFHNMNAESIPFLNRFNLSGDFYSIIERLSTISNVTDLNIYFLKSQSKIGQANSVTKSTEVLRRRKRTRNIQNTVHGDHKTNEITENQSIYDDKENQNPQTSQPTTNHGEIFYPQMSKNIMPEVINQSIINSNSITNQVDYFKNQEEMYKLMERNSIRDVADRQPRINRHGTVNNMVHFEQVHQPIQTYIIPETATKSLQNVIWDTGKTLLNNINKYEYPTGVESSQKKINYFNKPLSQLNNAERLFNEARSSIKRKNSSKNNENNQSNLTVDKVMQLPDNHLNKSKETHNMNPNNSENQDRKIEDNWRERNGEIETRYNWRQYRSGYARNFDHINYPFRDLNRRNRGVDPSFQSDDPNTN